MKAACWHLSSRLSQHEPQKEHQKEHESYCKIANVHRSKQLLWLFTNINTKLTHAHIASSILNTAIILASCPTMLPLRINCQMHTRMELTPFGLKTSPLAQMRNQSWQISWHAFLLMYAGLALPPATDDFDTEEDEPVLEPALPHLQVAYEFFRSFIRRAISNAFNRFVFETERHDGSGELLKILRRVLHQRICNSSQEGTFAVSCEDIDSTS